MKSKIILFIFILIFIFIPPVVAETDNLVEKENISLKSDFIEVDINIPVLKDTGNQLFVEKINSLFRNELTDFAHHLYQEAENQYEELEEDDMSFFPHWAKSHLNIYSKGNYLSIVIIYDQYTGGAHGLHWYNNYNIDIERNKIVELTDLLEKENYRKIILENINEQLETKEGYFVSQVNNFNQDNFYITEEGIIIYYPLYEIAPYAEGISEFLIPWEEFDLMN